LSDARNGWKGKSTFLSLLMTTMGDHASKADSCVLYRTRQEASMTTLEAS